MTNARGLQNLHPVDHGDVETLPGRFLVYFCLDWYVYVSCCVEKRTWAPESRCSDLEMSNDRLLGSLGVREGG